MSFTSHISRGCAVLLFTLLTGCAGRSDVASPVTPAPLSADAAAALSILPAPQQVWELASTGKAASAEFYDHSGADFIAGTEHNVSVADDDALFSSSWNYTHQAGDLAWAIYEIRSEQTSIADEVALRFEWARPTR